LMLFGPHPKSGGVIRLLPFRGLYDDAEDIPKFDVFDLTPSTCESPGRRWRTLERGILSDRLMMCVTVKWGSAQPDAYGAVAGTAWDLTPTTLTE
jgi:hypothetical protein